MPKGDFIKEKGDDWQAIQLTIEGNWIRELYLNNGDNLFSANYRDYLGSFKRKGNINYEIAKTAEKEPQSFWVYNNGITALTNKIITNKKIQFHGLSIINGAQTTGALAEASEEKAKSIKVSLRVVECKNKEKVNKIIKYNNTQNEIKAFDKRSGDKTQKRLAKDFFEKYSINYVHRRKQTRAPKNAITAHSVAPILCSFHGEPNIAHRHATEIFLQDDIYKKVFNDIIKVEHIFLLKKLSTAIDEYKKYLNDRVKEGEATEDDKDQQELLKYSASKTFIFYIIGRLAEVILNRRVTNLYNWMAKTDLISQDNTSIAKGWREVIQTILPHIVFVLSKKRIRIILLTHFTKYQEVLNTQKKVGDELKALLSSLLPTIGKQFDNIRKRTII